MELVNRLVLLDLLHITLEAAAALVIMAAVAVALVAVVQVTELQVHVIPEEEAAEEQAEAVDPEVLV